MALPRLQNWFLRSATVLGLVLILSGAWEYRVAGAVHELACGSAIMLLALAARRMWSRPATQAES